MDAETTGCAGPVGGLGDLRTAHAIGEVALALTDPSVDLAGIARATLRTARALTGSTDGFVASIDPATGELVAHTLTDMLPATEGERVAFAPRADGSFPGLWGHALNTRRPFVTNDPAAHPASIGVPAGHLPIRTFLAAPALLGDQLLGEVALANAPDGYSEAHVEAIGLLARLLALAIERCHTMAGLRDSLELHRSLVSSVVGGVTIHDRAGRIVEANERACELLGHTREQLFSGVPTYPEWYAVHEDGTRFASGTSPLRHTLRTGEPRRMVVMGLADAHAGVVRWLLTNSEPLTDAATGELRGAVATFTDITEQKTAESELRRSEERYRLLFETIQAAFAYYRARFADDGGVSDLVCETVNPAFTAITGLAREAVAGRSGEGFFATMGPGFEAALHAVVSTGETRHWEQLQAPQGRWFRVLAYAPQPGHVAILFDDITDAKEAEARLRRNEQDLTNVVRTSHVPMLLVDADMRVVLMNERFRAVTGYGPADFHDLESWWPLAYPDPAYRAEVIDEWSRGVEEAANGPDGPRPIDVVIAGRDGRRLSMRVGMGSVGDLRLVVFEDLTEQRRAEDAQRLASLGQLSAGVAHDFNNILMAMSLAAEVAAMSGDRADYARLAAIVSRSTRRGGDLCRNLMAFAMPTAPRREPVRVEAILDQALELASHQIDGAGVSLRREYSDTPREVLADPSQLQQVFLNLVINAVHAMPEGGTLSVSTRRSSTGGRMRVELADTGVGMAPEVVSRAFEPFFTTKGRLGESEVPGAGLGLSVSHGIITAHGGTIEIASQPGRGTTVAIEFPLADGCATEPADEPTVVDTKPSSPGGGRSVLVADDEEAIASLIELQLRTAGFEPRTVADTESAIAALRAEPFDLVLTDLMMPGGGAREILGAARQLPHPLPVVVMTGRLEQTLNEELLALGAARCLSKPFRYDDLVSALSEVLAPG